MSKNYKFETIALHGGQLIEPTKLSRAIPVYRTTSYIFKNTTHAANLFSLKESGKYIYENNEPNSRYTGKKNGIA